MALWLRKHSQYEDLDPATAVEEVVQRLRNDCTEARFQVLSAEADLRRLEEQTAGPPTTDEWSQQLARHRRQVADLRRDLEQLERKVEEAEAYAKSLAARASSIRARLSLAEFLSDLETGDAVVVFDRLQAALSQLEFEAQGFDEVEGLLD